MEKKTKKILAIQMGSVIADIQANIKNVENLLENNLIKYPADFVFLPEVWTCGWDCESFVKCAEEIESSQSISMLKRIAKKYHTNIIGGSFIEKKSPDKLYNTCPVINKNGELVCTYYKITCFLITDVMKAVMLQPVKILLWLS